MIGSSAPGSSTVPIVLAPSRFNHRFERTTVDSEPIQLEVENLDQAQASKTVICGICKNKQSRYMCPRSQITYCSVACFQQLPSSSTEAFYENRAQSILQLETKEHEEGTLRMLNRQYQQQRADEEAGVEKEEEDDVDLKELKELLSMVMTMNEEHDGNEDDSKRETNAKHSLEKLLSSMSPSLRAAFERDLQNGNLQNLALQEWHPWWRREFGNGNSDGMEESGEEIIAVSNVQPTKTLDERLLKIPNFNQLSKKPNPQLLFHVLDIVYSYCWTLRLFHGLSNIIAPKSVISNSQDSPASEAVTTFLSHSEVLYQQGRHQYSSLEEVLIKCTAASTKAKDECNTNWNVLVEDCSLIFSSRRSVARSLVEAIDMIQAAVQDCKKQRKEKGPEYQIEQQIQTLRKVRKKLVFLVAWTKQAAELEGQDDISISIQIEEWGRYWQHSNGDEELHELQIPTETILSSPSDKKASSEQHAATPWMTIAETRPK
ncbi:unnamed protein product [Cylindrotheca closterium]|uniref:HIT-type domain-containing protein n=1 Tax=Cylindrotheca closterium TaxID=2856 RepID=A0AAD2FW33_9STRA|nr:unnamed protein product [Cylindrotheca closterium]